MNIEPAADEPDDIATVEQAATAVDWLPLQTGNNWALENKQDSRFVNVEYTEDRVAYVTGLFNGEDGRWLGWSKTKPSELYVWDDAASEWRVFVRFGRATGTTWQLKGGACGSFTAKVTAKNATVKTPAGDFKKGYTVSFAFKPSPTARCAAPAFSTLTFVEGVGLVKIASPAFPQAPFLLKSAAVNGTKYPQAQTIKVADLEKNAAAYDGKTITVVAEPRAGSPICTKMACSPQNPCCNRCGANFVIGTTPIRLLNADPNAAFGCSGNDCGLDTCTPFGQDHNGDYAFTGVFNATNVELTVQSFRANTCQKSGCGGEVCDNTPRFTACVVRPEFACYATATCDVAASGLCAFGPEADVAACLAQY